MSGSLKERILGYIGDELESCPATVEAARGATLVVVIKLGQDGSLRQIATKTERVYSAERERKTSLRPVRR